MQGGAPAKQPVAELLLANLRLLDLDLRADWPDVTAKTFSTKDTQQNQKQRIKCTEWILYRLFELWDSEETRDKLQPFFPPLEPLQSLNLRGALFRALNELKKNGVLGRESILRKTMLDECKGEKLMELLVIFSTMVVRRADASHNPRTRSAADRISTAPMLSAAQQGSLIPLSIAHAASLTNMLKKREENRQRYAQLNDLLDGKRGQLRQRVKATVQHKRRESNVNEDAQVRKAVHDNWSGNSKWPQALLTGDDTNAGDLPLQKPFDEIWSAVSEGRTLGADPSSLGLVASLDRRVQVQKERLQMWQEFHEGLEDHEHSSVQPGQQSTPTAQFKFDRHQKLQLVPARAGNERDHALAANANAYSAILDTLRNDIANASRPRRQGGAGWTSKQEGASEYRSHDLFSPVKGSVPASIPASTRNLTKAPRTINTLEDRPSLLAPGKKSELNGFKIKRLGSNDSKTDTTLPPKLERSLPASLDEHDQPKRPATPEMETPIKITQASPVHEETAADRIISSVVNAMPTPAKPLSVTERTRMSMAFFNRDPDGVDSGIAIPPTEPDDGDEDALPARPRGGGDVQRRVSLLERTRLSMAAVPSQPLQSRNSLRLKRESRQSLFPVNQFETPGKPRALPDPVRNTTPTDKLFSDEAEYASVFKSRPRVALSPVPFTPEDGYSGLDESLELDEGSGTERVGGISSSPLAARRRLAAG